MVVYPFCFGMQYISQDSDWLWFPLWKRKDYDTKKAYTKERAAGS